MGGSSLLPSTGIGAVDWLIYAGAAVTALAVIWRYVARPTMQAFARFEDYGPVLASIAKEFKNDSGSTLKDTLDRLEANTAEALNWARSSKEWRANETATLARIEARVKGLEDKMSEHMT